MDVADHLDMEQGVDEHVQTSPNRWPTARWQAAQARHEERVDRWTDGWRHRRQRGQTHPVEDFLFTYYPIRPSRLRRWHPGAGIVLADDHSPRAGWRHYRRVEGATTVDLQSFLAARAAGLQQAVDVLRATARRPGQFRCFGLHEWAMVYRLSPDQVRHVDWPLRLGAAGTDAVVRSHQLRCSHFDAYRFFTPAAAPRNAVPLSRDCQIEHEQPACLHAAMDLYRWSATFAPAVPSAVMADCFELAAAARTLDMRASPYDLTALGYEPICIETPEGKTDYIAGQRAIAGAALTLRTRLLAVLTPLTARPQATDPSAR